MRSFKSNENIRKKVCKSAFLFSTISFTKSINNTGKLGSPCFKPMLESKKENGDLYFTHDLTIVYIDLIALTNLQLTFSVNNFYHKNERSILLKHFS